MKGFERKDQMFSLCGLNCGLCTMRLGGYCPGCGGGEGNQGCAIARCSLDHGRPEYCWQCGEFPCARYREIGRYDSFITHQNQLADLEKMRTSGLETYQAEQREKREILWVLLENYNDGRKKSFFALAVNLLELEELRKIMERLAAEKTDLPLRERTALAVSLCKEAAARREIYLRLRKAPGKSAK